MDERNENMSVPYLVHEGIVTRLERTNRRLVYALVMTILLMFVSNVVWLYFWNQYEYVDSDSVTTITRTVDVDAKEGVASYVGGSGKIINGTDSGYNNDSKGFEAEETKEEEWEE